ncbi:Tll0287-like domain-containing protein [Hyphococcus sp.]|uniref:Tll0287-like domain-containing protein n=1 Tax=Hyphococcus sp. TaxID=2038636 RepID=UPI0035C67633
MNRQLAFISFAAACILTACAREEAATQTPAPADVAAARAAANDLGARLKTRLLDALATGGPVAAIEVCNLEAPKIATVLSGETHMSVGRTALRWRNPANAPDDFERAAMEDFRSQIVGGADPAMLERAEIVTTPQGRQLRYMKPIMTGGPCTLCHGTDVSDEVKAAILARYPDDQATGFALGEFRGAFSITKDLEG